MAEKRLRMWLQAEALKELIARECDGKLPTHPSIEVRAFAERVLTNPDLHKWSGRPHETHQTESFIRHSSRAIVSRPQAARNRPHHRHTLDIPIYLPRPSPPQAIAVRADARVSRVQADVRGWRGNCGGVEALVGHCVLRCSVSPKATRTRRRCGDRRAFGSS